MNKLIDCPVTGRKMYWSFTDMMTIIQEIARNNDINNVISESTNKEIKEAFDLHYDSFKKHYNGKSNTKILDLYFERSMTLARELVKRDISFEYGFGWESKLNKLEKEFHLRNEYRLSHEGYTA